MNKITGVGDDRTFEIKESKTSEAKAKDRLFQGQTFSRPRARTIEAKDTILLKMLVSKFFTIFRRESVQDIALRFVFDDNSKIVVSKINECDFNTVDEIL